MAKKPQGGHKAKKQLPRQIKSKVQQDRQGQGKRATTSDRSEVRRVTTHRQGHTK